jgi:hypothetical protein
VQALVVVLEHDLPVGLDVDRRDVADPELRQPDPGQPQHVVLLVCQRFEQRSGLLAREVHEDEALPHVDVHGPQRRARPVDLVALDHRRGHERAVEGVAPRVVRTTQVAAHLAALPVAELRAAVPADVVEAAERVVLAAHQQDALLGDLDPPPRPRPWHPLRAADVHPVAEEDPVAVGLPCRVGVVRRPRERLVDQGHSLTI